MIKDFLSTSTSEKEKFIHDFSMLPERSRVEPYNQALLPKEYWSLFFHANYPAPHNFWILYIEGQAVARIGANASFSHQDCGFIGFFECLSDFKNQSLELFKTAITFLKNLQRTKILGPINFNTWFSYRLAAKHSDSLLFPFEPINPPFYLDIFEQAGFKKYQSYTTQGISSLHYKMEKFKTDFERATHNGYYLKALDLQNQLEDQIAQIYEISMNGFKDNYLFEPITKDLFTKLYVPIFKKFNFEYSCMAFNRQHKPVGFFFAFDYAPYLVLKSIAVLPECRGQGVSNAMMHLAFKTAAEKGLTKTISALVKDDAISQCYSSDAKYEWTHKYWLYLLR